MIFTCRARAGRFPAQGTMSWHGERRRGRVQRIDEREPRMPLVSMKRLLTDALSGRYAVCYCESWNLESLQAVIEAAEEMRSPVIGGFNGGFLMHPTRSRPERLTYYAGFARALRESSVPVAFLLNETDDLAQIEEGIELGFNAVM